MPLDDLVLASAARLDRLVRRLRLGPPPDAGQRRLLIVQIDGLSRAVLEHALRHGARAVPGAAARAGAAIARADERRAADLDARLPDGGDVRRAPGHSGLPLPRQAPPGRRLLPARAATRRSSRRRRPAGRRGIVSGGSAYGCVFTGGAANNLFSFAMIKRPTGAGLLRARLRVHRARVGAREGRRGLTAVELVRALLRDDRRSPVGESARGWKWLAHQDRDLGLAPRALHARGRARPLRGRARRSTSTTSTTTSPPTPSGRATAARSAPCAGSTRSSISSGACSGACPSIATISTCSPTTARRTCTPYRRLTGGRPIEQSSSTTSSTPPGVTATRRRRRGARPRRGARGPARTGARPGSSSAS